MSQYTGFIKGGEHTDDVPQQGRASGSGVVIVAPKQAPRTSSDALQGASTVLNIRRALQKPGRGRAHSPSSPVAGRRRASPTYEPLKPRGSPTYEPIKPRGSPSYVSRSKAEEPAEQKQQQNTLAGVTDHRQSHSSSRSDRSNSRDRGGHTSRRKHSRSPSRHRHKRRHRSGSRHGRRRDSSRDRKRRRGSRSRSRHRDSRHSRRSSHSRSTSRDRNSKRRGRSSRSNGRDRREQTSSRDRGRSPSPIPFTRQDKSRAWADERAYNTDNPVRRGKQGLGFGQQQQQHYDRGDRVAYDEDDRHHSRRDSNRGSATAGKAKAAIATIDVAREIPGYECMTAAEKLKARMRLVMAKAEQQGAAAEQTAAAVDSSILHPTASGMHAAGAGNDPSGSGWTRFVFDQHGELDEDKQARQKLMDAEVGQIAMGGVGNAADDVVDTSAAFIMGTGRAAAQRAGLARAAEVAHEDAIFGRPFGGSGVGEQEASRSALHKGRLIGARKTAATDSISHTERHQVGHFDSYQQPQVGQLEADLSTSAKPDDTGEAKEIEGVADADARQLAVSLGVSEVLIVEQQKPGLSWRERALAMKAKRQQ